MSIPYHELEKKWQAYWETNHINSVSLDDTKKKCYSLVMFPYPSADKLHLGHWFNYAPADAWSRFRKMQGYNVFQPMGFDAFGLPAENYAIKTGVHPRDTTDANVSFIRNQLKAIGAMYDWSYEVNTSEPAYYKWTQWLFLQFYKHGLAYRSNAPVNWCPSCQTVLANEQVINGRCERCEEEVVRKALTQWFFKITAYAEKLLDGLQTIEWPEKTKLMQQNWIGKSHGADIDFILDTPDKENIRVFTTRPDTLFGATYMVLAPEHALVTKITTPAQKKYVDTYIQQSAKVSEIERTSTIREKTGVFTGCYAINPVTNEKIPVWIADYVLITYGTGAIMAVPAHDERDFEFALKYKLPIRKVILEPGTKPEAPLKEAFTGTGTMINSGKYNDMTSDACIDAITDDLQKRRVGQQTVKYKFRDWLVSRQRYWGAPIPMIYCASCGEVPVPEEDLPILLPYDVDFKPKGIPPLATSERFIHATCPRCKEPAKREVDTMDTFVDSSWYFIRYLCNKLEDKPWDNEIIKKWLPVDHYIGGVDHATMHLLYARFFIMALHDMGHIPFSEPFYHLVHQGIIKGPDGQRMSKSRGNVINPEKYLDEFGSDVLRCYLMFGFDFSTGGPWDDSGVAAIDRFFNRIWRFAEKYSDALNELRNEKQFNQDEARLKRVLHQSIQGVTQDTERCHFNTAISRIMELLNALYYYTNNQNKKSYNTLFLRDVVKKLIMLLAPFAPHLAEELWEKIGEQPSVFAQKWPDYDPDVLKKETIIWVIQINGKIRERAEADSNLSQEAAENLALHFGRMPQLLAGKVIHKIIVVPKKLINIVVA
jgi:leucyl-tRNA synthetase